MAFGVAVIGAGGMTWSGSSSQGSIEHSPEVRRGDYATLVKLTGRVTAAGFRQALKRIDPLGQLEPFVELAPHAVAIRYKVDTLPLVTVPLAREKAPDAVVSPGLVGKRILLDPGHFGGAWSALEHRHFGPADAPLREGNLTYVVARALEDRLLRAGAEVLFTRGPPPEHPPRWTSLARQYALTLGDTRSTQELFDDFARIHLRQRGWMAEGLGADVTLSLHFNLCRDEASNGVIVFVPGHAMAGELETPTERFFALRRALEGDLETMDALARTVSRSLQQHLGLPAIRALSSNAPPHVTRKTVVDLEHGVWARNLAMLKRSQGPVLLIEGPCMNNPEERRWLLEEQSFARVQAQFGARTQAYAQAVFEALQAESGRLGRSITLSAR